jgi:hypothetical protein
VRVVVGVRVHVGVLVKVAVRTEGVLDEIVPETGVVSLVVLAWTVSPTVDVSDAVADGVGVLNGVKVIGEGVAVGVGVFFGFCVQVFRIEIGA